MTFQGWPEEALDFYEGLAADNSKSYWTAHRQVYEACVLAPMTDLVADLAPQFGPGKIFRPYRDVRFSKDKSPYRTEIGAVIGDGYVRLSADGLAAGNGMYMMSADQLSRYRQAVAQEQSGAELAAVIGAVEGEQIAVRGREELKTAPRGYPADHQRIGLLRCKGLIAWREWPAGPWLGTAEPSARIARFLTVTQPFADWLRTHVGPPQDAPARR
ncbi:MAG: DUF2461 domain-containing protein [Streptosporangiaceae bacterium]